MKENNQTRWIKLNICDKIKLTDNKTNILKIKEKSID